MANTINRSIENRNVFNLDPTDRVAYFTAHPDDASMFMAYALDNTAKLIAETGSEPLHAYIASNGEASTKGDRDFVLAGRRREEAMAEAEYFGVPKSRLHLPGHPDSKLGESYNHSVLTRDIDSFIDGNKITTAITLGAAGGDGHSDHVATHHAVVSLQRNFPRMNIFSLNSKGQGEIVIPKTNIDVKLGGLALNSSQFEINRNEENVDNGSLHRIGGFVVASSQAESLSPYQHYLEYESYDAH